jgi:magnesium transporter
MSKKNRKRRKLMAGKPGAAPGTLAVMEEAAGTTISAVLYGPTEMRSLQSLKASEVRTLPGKAPVVWISVTGLAGADTIREVGEIFALHPLVLEDILTGAHRPKLEDHGTYLYSVLNCFRAGERLSAEQLNIVLLPGCVLTFCDKPVPEFEPVIERLSKAVGRIRTSGADYLAYALFDAVVDSYFPLLESFDEAIEAIEEAIFRNHSRETPVRIFRMKQDLLLMRRSVWPLREMLGRITRDALPLVTAETRKYSIDCLDHAIQVIELVESFRDVSNGLMDLHISNVSNSTNEVMKTLTLIATIFIPLTFVAGLYGMNFDANSSPFNMPELKWYYGYPMALGLMLVVAVGMVVLFRRRGWLGPIVHRGNSEDS